MSPPDLSSAVAQYRVVPGQAGDLVEFLAAARGESRRAAKRLLDERRVFVNGRRVWMARHAVRAGDRVEVQPPAARAISDRIPILVAAGPWRVADKPAGLLSNGDPRSVESRLREQLGLPQLTAVHRLDRDTTGCLLFALTRGDAERLIPLFRERLVRKIYHALVFGRVSAAVREIRAPIDDEEAVSRIRVVDANPEASLVEVLIETGRTHQIRKHLLQIGHPIAGDRAYGNSRARDARGRALPRQMLHASRLSFADPETGRTIAAESPLPADFRSALRSYGLRGPGRTGRDE